MSGTLFHFYSMRTLGRFFTYDVAVSTGQHVVERGPYRWLRHPSYLGSLAAEVGLGRLLHQLRIVDLAGGLVQDRNQVMPAQPNLVASKRDSSSALAAPHGR